MNMSNLRFSKTSRVLETSQNSKKDASGLLGKNWPKSPKREAEYDGYSLFWIPSMCKHMLITVMGIS
jgi:hypothetical protein